MTRWTAGALALACLLVLRPAAAQDFVPFEEGTTEASPAPDPATTPAPAAPEAAPAEADEDAPAAPEPTAAPAKNGAAPAEDGAPGTGGATDGTSAAPPAPLGDDALGVSDGDAAAPRLVKEALVEETTEPIGASALAPATVHNDLASRSNDRPVLSIDGAVGLPHLPTARVGVPGSVRIGATGEVFAGSDFLLAGDRQSRQGLTLAVGWTPLPWLEAYGSVIFTSTVNTLAAPQLLQVMGDSNLGAKGVWRASDAFSFGADLRLSLYPSIGDTGYGAVGGAVRALGTFDARALAPRLPLLVHLDLGMLLDGTGGLSGSAPLDRVEEFALGIERFNRFSAGAALEAPLPWVTPFASWTMAAPLGDVPLPEVRDAAGDVRTLGYGEVVSNVLTLGARVTAVRDVTFLAAVDLGLSGAAVPGVPATMPWNLLVGVSYTFDPTSQAERVTRVVARTYEVEKKVEVAPPAGWVEGTVRDAATGKPVDAAIVAVGPDATPVATQAGTGRFRTLDLPPGAVTLEVRKAGYAPATVTADVAAGTPASVEVKLEPVAQDGTLILAVTGRKKRPVAATVTVQGPKQDVLRIGKKGRLETALPPGKYRIQVASKGYLTREKDLVIEPAAKILADLELAPKSKRKLVIFKKDRLELKRQIHFQTGRSEILPDSYQILDQVMDLIAKHHIERIRIEGHTDSQGSDRTNLRLSQARADAVRAFLVEKGISPERLEAVGFGESRPVAPNLTARGRAMNRRVEFHVVAN